MFVFLQVIAQDQARPLAVPLDAAHLLTGTLRDEAAFVAILEPDDDVRLGVSRELVDLKVANDVFVLAQFLSDVAQVLDCQVLGGGDDDDVIFDAEEGGRQAEVVCQRRALRMAPRRRYRGVDDRLAVQRPAFAVQVRRRDWRVVHRRQIGAGEVLDQQRSEFDPRVHEESTARRPTRVW